MKNYTLPVNVINGVISLTASLWFAYLIYFTHLLNKSFSHLFIFFSLLQPPTHPSFPSSPPPFFNLSHRAQEVFRQAMRSPVVRLEVVPSSNRERYEKSLIGQLLGNSAGPDCSPRITKTKEPPPPVKAKPVFKPPENPSMRLADEASIVEANVSLYVHD